MAFIQGQDVRAYRVQVMIDFITNFYNAHSSVLLFYAYLLPLFINTMVFTRRVFLKYRHDLSNCTDKFYMPTLTLGVLFAYILGIFTPLINSVVFVFNTLPTALKMISVIFQWFFEVFYIPLVPHRPEEKK
jgi:hypothetical protein